MQDLKLQRLSEATTNSKEFEGIGCLFFEEHLQNTIIRSIQQLSPLHNFCLCYKTRITATPATMFLQTWNGFEIDHSKDNNHIRQKIIGD